MKEFLTDTLELDRFIVKKYFQNDENVDNELPDKVAKKHFKSPSFFRKSNNLKHERDFSSLDRVRIVLESFEEGTSVNEVCEKAGISRETFESWKNNFVEAFDDFSEESLVKDKLTTSSSNLLLKESGQEVFKFFNTYIHDNDFKNLLIPEGERLSSYSSFDFISNIIVLEKLNNFRQINKHLEGVNTKLPTGGVLMGCFETFQAKASKQSVNNIPVIKHVCALSVFLFKRVCPKLPYINKVYFYITKGRNRLLSKAEALGRLVSCGFDIVDTKVINGFHYFVVKKIKEPAYDMSPSYGPFFRMRRIGKGGKIIRVFKLRTMHPYSEYLHDYILKMNGYSDSGKPANDFRLVPYAKLLRRYWLDELPQLINLLKGDLKLVGCRPVSERYFQDIPEEIQKLRLTQKPGCIPPYVALNRSSSVESVLEAEKQYLQDKIKNPYFTDTKYFFKAIYNILFKNKRSA